MEELEAPNLEVHRLDVATDDLPPGAFDLIHTRAVLMHIPARDMVIDKLMAGLRPGGWLLLEEYDDFPLAARPDSAYAEVWGMYRAGFAAHGYAMGWARCLPQRLAGSGLVEVGHHCEVPFFPGGSPMAQLMQLTFAQAEEQALAGGATEGLLKEANTLLDDAGEWFPCFALVSAWGRRGC